MERLKKNLSFNAVASLLVSMLLISSFVFFASNVSYGQDQTTLYVDPTPVAVEVCNPFTVNVNIADVYDLVTWNFNMTFDPALVDFLSVVEGPFLSSLGPTLFGFYNGTGWVVAWCALMMYPPTASGSGTLAYVNFHCKGQGSSPLHFKPFPETALFNSFGDSITFKAIDGIVTQYEPTSWYIKPPYPDYAQSGMPDFDERQSNWYWRYWAYPDVVAVWQHYDDHYQDWDIYYSIYTDPNIWWTLGAAYARPIVSDSPMQMSFLPGDDQHPAISWYSSNYAIAVWQHYTETDWDIWFSVFTPNVGWSVPGPVATNPGYNDMDPAIAFDTNGWAICVWVHGDQPAAYIYYSMWNPVTMSWVGPNTFLNPAAHGPGYAAKPEIDVDSNHKAVTIWTDQLGGGGTQVFFSWTNPSFNPPAIPGWTAPAVVPGCPLGVDGKKGISPDKLGNNLMDWGAGSSMVLYYAKFVPGGAGWTPGATVLTNPNTNGYGPDLAYDLNNKAIAVYSQSPAFAQISYSYWNGSGWQPAGGRFAASSGNPPDEYPAVAFIKNNKAVLVWNAYPEPAGTMLVSEIYYSVYTPTYPADSWTQAKKIYEPNNPRLFLTGSDYFVDIASPTGSATTPPSVPPATPRPADQDIYWTWCAPLAVANSIWWFDSKYEPNAVTPPTISDGFPLVKSYNSSVWDDHDPRNVKPFVEHLAYLMDTDGMRTKLYHDGTTVWDMQAGITHYLSWSGVNPLGDVDGNGIVDHVDVEIVSMALNGKPGDANWTMSGDIWPETVTGPRTADNVIDQNDLDLVTQNLNKTGLFYEHTTELYPSFRYIEEEVERCQDVVLCLGFYQNGDRDGGHFVTVAGVNSTTFQLLISNPIRDDYEALMTPGRSPVPHVHMPPEPPYITHNNASLVSQDAYTVVYNGVYWALQGYFSDQAWEARIEFAVITSPYNRNIATTNVVGPTIINRGDTLSGRANVNVTVANLGDNTENFNVTAYASSMLVIATIGTKAVTVAPGIPLTTINFPWNTTGYTPGNYTIWSSASFLWGETNFTDNTYTDGKVTVKLIGDLGSRVGSTNVFAAFDNLVTSADLSLFLQCYKGTAPPADMYLGDLGSRVGTSNVFFAYDGLVTSADLSLFLQCYKGGGP
jgi:hypothetical protein